MNHNYPEQVLRLHYTDAESLSMIRGTINQRERSLKEAKIVYQDGMKRLQNQTGIVLKEKIIVELKEEKPTKI